MTFRGEHRRVSPDDRVGQVDLRDRSVGRWAARNYPIAAEYFTKYVSRTARPPPLERSGPCLVLALCLAGQVEAARRLAPSAQPEAADERHFWEWLGRRFGVGPFGSRSAIGVSTHRRGGGQEILDSQKNKERVS